MRYLSKILFAATLLLFFAVWPSAAQNHQDEIREEIEVDALDAKIQDTYSAQVDAWMEEMNVEYFFENFGITAA